MRERLVILDRDGVINYDSVDYIKSPAEWRAIPGSLAAIAALNNAGYRVAIATNQSGIGRGLYSTATFLAIQEKLTQELTAVGGHIDYLAYCPHLPTDDCVCRKPRPGLLQQIAEHFACDLTAVPVIGDSARDIAAAIAMNCQPYLIASLQDQTTLAAVKQILPTLNLPIYPDLAAAVAAILASPAE